MAQIPDFNAEAFDDMKELRIQLTSVLRKLNDDANREQDISLGKNVGLAWVDDGKTPLPQGYEIANGQKGTFDFSKSKVIIIQKVK